jgi:hypothetical protein
MSDTESETGAIHTVYEQVNRSDDHIDHLIDRIELTIIERYAEWTAHDNAVPVVPDDEVIEILVAGVLRPITWAADGTVGADPTALFDAFDRDFDDPHIQPAITDVSIAVGMCVDEHEQIQHLANAILDGSR